MNDIGYLLHCISIALTIGLTCIGVGIGGGLASMASIEALNTQPHAEAEITRASLVGLALVETSGVLGMVLSLILFYQPTELTHSLYVGIGELGIAFAVGISGVIAGIAASFPVKAACKAIARQPFFSQSILNVMLLTQSIIQTPIIFAFLISLLIKTQLASATHLGESIRLLASGICIGLGSIGPGLGLGRFAQQACKSLGINRHSYQRILPFTIISQAIIETPIVFSLIIALLLIQLDVGNEFSAIVGTLAAAFCMGIGTLSPGYSSAQTAVSACEQIAYKPEHASTLSRTSLIAQALIDAAAIYALLVSLLILLFR